MKRMLWALVLICFPLSGMAKDKAIGFGVPFGNSTESLGFAGAIEETLSNGPAAICVSKRGIWIADSVNQRVSLWGTKSKVKESREVPFAPAALWCNSEGHIWVMNGSRETAFFHNGVEPGSTYPLPEKSASFATGPSGDPWVVLSDGHGVPLLGKAGIKRSIPLGKDHAFHAIGRKSGTNTGEVLVWPWSSPAEVKRTGSMRTIKFEVEGLLGSITPLGMDNEGHLYVHVESLAKTAPVRVQHQVFRVSREGKRSHVEWTPSAIHPHLDGLHLTAAGQLFRFSSLAKQLMIQGFASKEWQEGGR